MKALICGDVHWATYSSIIRKRGTEYSKRLENCINSVNWVEQTAEENGCDTVIYLGDFFDRADATAEEISALNEVQWSNVKHKIIVGNHELGSADGDYSTAKILNLLPEFEVISKPSLDVGFGYYLLYLPYIFEKDRKTVSEYFKSCLTNDFVTQEVKNVFIVSHNDLKGVNYGVFESKEGFDVSDIENHCELCFNGHIHNGSKVGKNIIDVGNLTGQNFNEDATKYKHVVYILETRGCEYQLSCVENPFAYNFYKIEATDTKDFASIINSFKKHSIVSFKCLETYVDEVKSLFDNCPNVDEYRVISVPVIADVPEEDIYTLISADHIAQFRDYILNKLGNSADVISELQEISNVN